ncbi:MAG: tetratricopeptide repeat protein [Hyphomonadaceae bacterium]|nr:MAG: hypothetical protein FD160_2737 [Caulobacteraceae bacterium]MBT9445309.1 tetratricopeptide repeat protein [Hyphomonadaceae bacterium]TPW02009.1 MAG: hypothetical protein FD124_3540 [Alphaproteobacteria bacterium]
MAVNAPTDRFNVLLGYLRADPDNAALLADAAMAGAVAGAAETACDLFARLGRARSLTAVEQGAFGRALMTCNRMTDAAAALDAARAAHPDDPALRFNHAWAMASCGRQEAALTLLDDATTAALPQAATLKVQLLHAQGAFEEAMDAAKAFAREFKHPDLDAAMSVLALDLEDVALAEASARAAGDHPDALTSLAMLSLRAGRNVEADTLFARALADGGERRPRAWIGSGLSAMSQGAFDRAATELTHGARQFGDHLGSWIAAAWAQILRRDLAAAKTCLDEAMAHDRNFAEIHGTLAVIAALENRTPEAEAAAATASRLDPESFSAAFARMLLLQTRGKPDQAQALFERAIATPINADGETIAKALVRVGLR